MVDSSHILVIDDDSGLRALLRKFLGKHGYRVSVAEDISEAHRQMGLFEFDLLIVDVMLPDETGIEFTTRLRGGGGDSLLSRVPILMLTARGEGSDRILGLQAGADDYLPKPFEPQELVLRVAAILRRSEPRPPPSSRVCFGGWVFDLSQKRLSDSGGSVMYLTGGEADLLYVLARHCNETISRADILRHYSREEGVDGRVDNQRGIDVQMTRLRSKLESDPKRPEYLMTVRNKGYLLRADPPDSTLV